MRCCCSDPHGRSIHRIADGGSSNGEKLGISFEVGRLVRGVGAISWGYLQCIVGLAVHVLDCGRWVLGVYVRCLLPWKGASLEGCSHLGHLEQVLHLQSPIPSHYVLVGRLRRSRGRGWALLRGFTSQISGMIGYNRHGCSDFPVKIPVG